MRGFYSGNKPKRKLTLKDKIESDPCSVCGLGKGCFAPKMKPHGDGRLGIYIKAEAPGKDEDEKEIQLIGEAGQLLRECLKPYDIDIDRDCLKDNSVRCRPPKNRTPNKQEIKCCKIYNDQTIKEFKPKFIWLFGGPAIQSFYGDRFRDKKINRWRGLCIPDKSTGAWVLPMFHPSYVLRNDYDANLRCIFEKDLKFAVSCLRKNSPKFVDWESRVEIILKESEAEAILRDIDRTATEVFFDYETNALKPFYAGAQLYSLSIATSSKKAYSFLLTNKLKLLFRRILLNPNIRKSAHNLKFESVWSRIKLKLKEIANMYWCTMNCAHIIDTRHKFTSLDFQTYINFGMDNYSKDIKPYLKNVKGSKLNRVAEAPIEKLLKYGGLDSVLGFALYEKQKLIINRKNEPRKEGFKLWIRGLEALADSEIEGICVRELYYQEQEWILDEKIKKLEKELLNSKEAKLFKQKTGRELKLKKEFSPVDLRKLFFDILGYKAEKLTAKAGAKAIDVEVLHSFNNKFANKIIERRKLAKLKGTYLGQFKSEVCNGKLHPFFNLHIARSLRSSSSDPNFQNIPNREEEARALVRKGIISSKGYKLLCADYGSQEVRGAVIYSDDLALKKYIEDGIDPHFDQTKNVFSMSDKQVTKELRSYIKNQFVFPEIYGSYFGSIAPNIYDKCWDLRIGTEEGQKVGDGVKLKQYLKDSGIIRNYRDIRGFVYQVKKAEKKFWNKFYKLREWQEKIVRDYGKKGYIELFMGFRRGGYLTRNQIFNTPIQGTSFHLLLWSYIKVNDWRKKKKIKSKLIGEIHDEMIWDLHPDEEDLVMEKTVSVMEDEIRERFEWINVPLKAELAITEIDQSWYHKKDI